MTLGHKIRKGIHTVGKKMRQAERLGQKTGHLLDVSARKVKNTSHRVEGAIGAVQPYLNGIPLVETAATVGRNLAKATEVGADVGRKVGQTLEKASALGKSKQIEDKLSSFV